MTVETEVLIIGGGITGASIARELSQYDVHVTVAEESPDIFTGQTKSSHGFVYNAQSLNMAYSLVLKSVMSPGAPLWEPETMKIKLGIQGYELFESLAKTLEVPYIQQRILVIARSGEELKILRKLHEITDLMGIKEDVSWLSRKDILDMEPNITRDILAGLYEEKRAKIIFPPDYALANVENAGDNGVNFIFSAEVTGIRALNEGFVTDSRKGSIRSRFVVNAAGSYADRVADLAEARDDWGLVHNRTQMVILDRRVGTKFKTANMILGPARPGFVEGINIQSHGNPYLLCGAFNAIENRDATETRSEWFKENLEYGRGLMPVFSVSDVIASFVGIRTFNSRDPEDHLVEFSRRRPGFLNAVVRLPGFAVSAGMAKHVVSLLGNEGLPLVKKPDYNPLRRGIPRFSELRDEKRESLIKRDPKYGHVVCRCEMVTEGEIVEAIRRGARTVQGIQFRTRAGMGRCQRGFCGPRVVAILARELGIPRTQVTFKGPGSEILKYRSKELLQ